MFVFQILHLILSGCKRVIWRCERFTKEDVCKSWLKNTISTKQIDFQPRMFDISSWPGDDRESRRDFLKQNKIRGKVSFDDYDDPSSRDRGTWYH